MSYALPLAPDRLAIIKTRAKEVADAMKAQLAEMSGKYEDMLRQGSLGESYREQPLLMQLAYLAEKKSLADGGNVFNIFNVIEKTSMQIFSLERLAQGLRDEDEASSALCNILRGSNSSFPMFQGFVKEFEAELEPIREHLQQAQIKRWTEGGERRWAKIVRDLDDNPEQDRTP